MNNLFRLLIQEKPSTLKSFLVCSRTFKSELKIKWVRPEKISCIDPRKSGDKEAVVYPDLKELPVDFRDSDCIKHVEEPVLDMLSLAKNRQRYTSQVIRENLENRVRRHMYDNMSIETKIAAMTAKIRVLQQRMSNYPHDGKCKAFLKELIDKRKKFLKYLRRWDYKRFEWILEQLNIEYKPPPTSFHWITRKESLQKLTNTYCETLKAERLKAYEKILKSQQEDFLRKKLSVMEQIAKDQKEYSLPLTITKEDIKKVQMQLEQCLKKD